jgi:hypothetical protein
MHQRVEVGDVVVCAGEDGPGSLSFGTICGRNGVV